MLTFTEQARKRVLSFIETESTPVALRVAVLPGSPLAPQYDLSLVDEWDKKEDDAVVDLDGFAVYVDSGSADKLDGATVDWIETVEGGGFQVENPSVKPIGAEPLTGDFAQQLSKVIDTRINPAVAMHGGRVALVDVKDDIVYVELSGGCQGCGMATVTLKQGIEQMLREAFPQIVEVVDVTDHSVGTNPYYQAAK